MRTDPILQLGKVRVRSLFFAFSTRLASSCQLLAPFSYINAAKEKIDNITGTRVMLIQDHIHFLESISKCPKRPSRVKAPPQSLREAFCLVDDTKRSYAVFVRRLQPPAIKSFFSRCAPKAASKNVARLRRRQTLRTRAFMYLYTSMV